MMKTNGTALEAAMLADLLDAEPITHLTEDENPWFSDPVESRTPTPYSYDAEQVWSDMALHHQMQGF